MENDSEHFLNKSAPAPPPDGTDEVAMLTEAFQARRRGDHQAAVDLFRRVFAQDPSNPYPLIEAARVEGLRLDGEAMRSFLDEAETICGDDDEAWTGLASAWLEALHPEDCLRVCDLADFAKPYFAEGIAEFPLDKVRIRRFGDVALIHAENAYTLKDGRRGVNRYTDIWAKRGGRWWCVAAHITVYKAPG